MNEKPALPIYPSESPEKWLQLRAACEKGDDVAVRAACEGMDLSARLSKLFVVAVAEETELQQIIAAAEGMAEKFVSLGQEFCLLTAIAPTKIEKIREQIEQQQTLRDERLKAQRAVAAAERATSNLRWLELWLPELFGKVPPPHAGHLGNVQPSPKTTDIAQKNGIDAFYSVGSDSWRKIGGDQTRKRKYTSFSPLAPRN